MRRIRQFAACFGLQIPVIQDVDCVGRLTSSEREREREVDNKERVIVVAGKKT